MMIRGVSVDDIRKALGPVNAPKVLVLRGYRSFEDESASWAVDQVLKRLKAQFHDLEVSDMALPSYRILSGVSNDPDDSLFAPEDQFPLVLDAIRKADCVILAAQEAGGFPNSEVVQLFGRLAQFDENKLAAGSFERLFNKKPAAVIMLGSIGAYQAAIGCMGALNLFGFALPSSSVAVYAAKGRIRSGDSAKSKEFAASLDQLSGDLADACAAIKR